MLEGLLGIVVGGLVIGAIARFAVPGPDPLPIWATIVLGILGSLAGGFVGAIVATAVGANLDDAQTAASVAFVSSLVGAIVLLVLYRRVVQDRPVTGPDAQRLPLRPRGLNRIARGKDHRFLEDTAEPAEGAAAIEQLRKLVALRDAGRIEADEYERRKAALVARI